MKRLIVAALIGVSIYFALFGGEYSVFEVRRVRGERTEMERRLSDLERANDSLRSWADALETDSATIERLARERYGMIRSGEVLYRLARPEELDSVGDSIGDAEPR